MAGSHIAIPSIRKVGKGTLNNLGKYLKSSDMKNAVIYFGNGLIELFGDGVMQSLKDEGITVVEYRELDSIRIEDIIDLAFSIDVKAQVIVGIGGGKVIEAKSTQKGVVSSRLSEWHAWGRLKGVSYTMEMEVDPMVNKCGPAVVDVPNDGTVRVRAKGSTSAQVVTTLPEGAEVTVEAIEGDWCKVSYQGTGYIMNKFLVGR